MGAPSLRGCASWGTGSKIIGGKNLRSFSALDEFQDYLKTLSDSKHVINYILKWKKSYFENTIFTCSIKIYSRLKIVFPNCSRIIRINLSFTTFLAFIIDQCEFRNNFSKSFLQGTIKSSQKLLFIWDGLFIQGSSKVHHFDSCLKGPWAHIII